MSKEFVVLVNEQDQEIGLEEKLAAHEKALLHRAFSLFVFNSKGEMLIHQRAANKYHCPNLWTNAVCSHPRQGETLQEALKRRSKEELNLNLVEQPTKLFEFIYKAKFDNGLTEHEYDHVFAITSDEQPRIVPEEVQDFKYLLPTQIEQEIEKNPEKFTYWFRKAFPKVIEKWSSLVMK